MRTLAHLHFVGAQSPQFVVDNLATILFGIVSAITSVAAIYYAREANQLQKQVNPDIGDGRSVTLFLTRQSMIDALFEQYDRALSGSEVWAHAVGLQNFPGEIEKKVLSAASRGASFRYLVPRDNPAISSFTQLFAPIRAATIRTRTDNRIRMQGLRGREVIVAFPTLTTYTAIRVTDQSFLDLVEHWFDERWDRAEPIDTQTDVAD